MAVGGIGCTDRLHGHHVTGKSQGVIGCQELRRKLNATRRCRGVGKTRQHIRAIHDDADRPAGSHVAPTRHQGGRRARGRLGHADGFGQHGSRFNAPGGSLQFGCTRIRLQRNIARQCNGRQDGDDGDHDHQFDDGKTGLLSACHGVSPGVWNCSISPAQKVGMCMKTRKALLPLALGAIIFEISAKNCIRFTAGYTLKGVWAQCLCAYLRLAAL